MVKEDEIKDVLSLMNLKMRLSMKRKNYSLKK